MGIITEISNQKHKNRVNIFVDDEFKSGLDVETAVKFCLKVGKEINDVELNNIIIESETNSAFNVALRFLSLTPKSAYEVKQKLIKKGYSDVVISKAIEKLEEYKYIDDEEYSRLYLSSCKNRSKREIENKLRQKGISKEIINILLEDVDDDQEENNAFIYAQKYLKNKQLDEKNKRHLITNLIRKGYSYDIAVKVMNKSCREE